MDVDIIKNLKPRARPTPLEALAVAAQTAPTQPPTQVTEGDRPTTLNLRFRESSIAEITISAEKRGLNIKQVVGPGFDRRKHCDCCGRPGGQDT